MSYDPYVFTHGTGSEVTRYNEGQTSSHQYDTLDPKQVTCRAWLSGACKSRYCYYTHEHRDYVSPPQPYTCWFWSMGRCSESAETCTYTHSLDALTAQRPQRFVRDHPVIGGRNAAIAIAAKDAGFDTRNGQALSRLLKAVKHANNGFEDNRPRPREPLAEPWKASHAQPAEVRTHGDYYRPKGRASPVYGDYYRPNPRASPVYNGDYYRPKRPASPIHDDHNTLFYDEPPANSKRQRTAKSKIELPNLPPPTQANRSILARRDTNTILATRGPNTKPLAIRTRAIAPVRSRKSKKSQPKLLTFTEKEQALLHAGTRRVFEKAEYKVKGCVDALTGDKAALSKRWEADARLQHPDMAGTLDNLAEGVHQALLGLEVSGSEIEKILKLI